MPSSGCAAWFYPRASLNDLRSPVFWRDVFAELLAVTILMTMVALVVISNNEEHYKITTTHLGLFALVLVYLLIEGFGPINGTHLNPTGSVSLFIAGKISFARAVAYIVAQVLGTLAGSGLGYLMTPEHLLGKFPSFDPVARHLTPFQGVLTEGFFGFVLIFVALSCHDTENRPPAVMPSLAIASCIAIGLIAAGTHSGGLMNPIIALGPAILSNKWANHWVYWVGPLIGGPLAVPVYKIFILIKQRYGPKPAVASKSDNLALEPGLRDELITLLERLKKEPRALSA